MGRCLSRTIRRSFCGTDAEYNTLVNKELNEIEDALDGIDDDVDALDYNTSVPQSKSDDGVEWRADHKSRREGLVRH